MNSLKIKKALSILMASVMMFTIVGCSSSSTTTESTTTTEAATTETATTETATTDSDEPIFLTLGGMTISGTNYPLSVAMAKIFNREIPNASAVAIATAGSGDNVQLLSSGEIELGICRALEAVNAMNGVDPYEEMPWIRSLTGGLFYDAVQVIAAKDAGIETVYDFAGKKVAVGTIGSASIGEAELVLAAFGMTFDDIDPQYMEYSQATEMMTDGLIDGSIFGLTMGSATVSELMLSDDFFLLPIDGAEAEALLELNEEYRITSVPADVYPCQSYEVATVGCPPDQIICNGDLMSDELAYAITKAIYENTEELIAVTVVMENFGQSLVSESEDMLIPYHPGTEQYFIDCGWITG